MLRFHVLLLAGLFFGGICVPERVFAQGQSLELALIRPASQGFSNAGWTCDRYPDLPTLDAKKSMVMADLPGPGVIHALHTTRHWPKELAARGVVLLIYFDDDPDPAVMCPLADFFGDGCNGGSMNFSTNFIECAPGSYNCYIPMPFEKHAKVILRNDTDTNFSNYSYVEWEKLPEWKKDLGYFHATYGRKCFQLGPRSRQTFLELSGNGQLIGRQYSIATEEPMFKEFNYVMEGNNEVDIDGEKRAIDYLGSEDSFTFSWGFQHTFAGLRGNAVGAAVRTVETFDLPISRPSAHPLQQVFALDHRLDHGRRFQERRREIKQSRGRRRLLGRLRHGALLVSGCSRGIQAQGIGIGARPDEVDSLAAEKMRSSQLRKGAIHVRPSRPG